MRAVLAREPDLAESDPARFAWWMVTVRLTSMQMWCGTHWRHPRESEDPCAVAHREGTAYVVRHALASSSRKRGPMRRGLSRGHGAWVPAFAGMTSERAATADIAGFASCAGRRGHAGRWNIARTGIPRPSAYSGCTLRRARAARRARQQPPRPCAG